MKKRVFDLKELRDTPQDVDLIEKFGKHAEFQGEYQRLTLFGWAVLKDYRLARRLIQDVDVNSWCRKDVYKTDTPIDAVVLFARPSVNERWNILRLLMIHGADRNKVRRITLERNALIRVAHNVDLLDHSEAYAKEFRAKLCAIFWVTQNIPVWRDMGEPLVERVFMSTLQIDHPEWRFG